VIFFVFVLTALTVARVTRLVTEDTILDEPRQWLLNRLWNFRRPADVHESSWTPRYWVGKLHYLLTCPWCSSIWCAAGALGLLYLFTDLSIPLPVFWIPGLSMASVLLLEWTDGIKQVDVNLRQKKP
jgi:hypothetical protein